MSETQVTTDRVLTVPNALSALRLVGVPVFLWLILTTTTAGPSSLLMVSGFTDYLDGKIARRFNLISPASASCSTRPPTGSTSWRRCSAWPGGDIVPWWLVALLLAREVFIARPAADPAQPRLRPPCRCTSSARPRPSACSTPSRCC